jgi:hypothetical protein
MTTTKGKFYRYTGAPTGTGAAVSNINFTAWDSNASLSSYPIRRGAAKAYSYIVALAYYFEADPGTISSIYFWPSLVGGTLDDDVSIKIATTLQTTYKQATGTPGTTGTTIASLYTGVTTEDIFNYSSTSPRYVAAADQILSTGIGRYTKYILLQMEVDTDADLGAVPASTVTLRLNHGVVEVPA